MNMQALIKQAQKLQGDVTKTKSEIDNKIFTDTNSFVTTEMYGTKKIKSIKISEDIDLSEIDKEMLEDIILVSLNNNITEIDKEINEKLGKYNIPGMF